MEFFKKYFKEENHENEEEMFVKCPFPHKDHEGNQYYESIPSAHINLSNSLFHCKVCGTGMSEAAFLSKIQGISYKDAIILLKTLNENDNNFAPFRKNFMNTDFAQNEWKSLGLTMNTADLLQIGYDGGGLDFPVFIYGELLDTRNYKAGRKPKVISQKGAKNLLLPFDLWREDDRPTLLCAGEKDMAIARQMGFNALSFTGGEQAFPKLFKASFRGKKIFIAYDNDQAGQEGSRKVASLLKDVGAFPHVITGHYEVCTEKGEDIHDFFCKYGRTSEDLQKIMDETPEFTEEEHLTEQVKRIPLVTIEEASQGRYLNRLVSSRVSVVATYEEIYSVPDFVELTKTMAKESCLLPEGHVTEWSLDEENVRDILYLIDSNLKEAQINEDLKRLAGIPHKEKFIGVRPRSRTNVFKAVVTDDLESEVVSSDGEAKTMRELLVYSIGEPINAGVKYRIFYKPTAHPLKGQQIIGIVTKMEDSDTSINRFNLNEHTLDTMKCFKVQPGETVREKMNELYERAKGIIGVEARKDVTFATDLFYHTPLNFYFGKRLERGYLDVMMIGPERSGKSQAAKKLMETYELGMITSLKTATIAGLLGGSDQTAGGWKTKLGLLPRSHKGAVIMEEFSGGGQELVSKLTEVRSSNRVRITRVNGTIDVPAMVRMMSISNPSVTASGGSIPIKNYPSGIQIILDLVGASEDIARYDFFVILDEPDHYTSPLDDFDLEPFPKESYLNRVRWVWSRKPEQIVLERPVLEHIVAVGQGLNDKYNSHIKIFGPEAWKKLSRIAIACAGMLCSSDETGQKIVVTKEHVDWARSFLVACYDNKLFKLKEYVEAQRRLVECDPDVVKALQGMYNIHPIMLQQLEMSVEMSQRDLQAISGLEMKEFPKVLTQLAKFGFVQFPGGKIVPTVRFREAMNRIDKQTYMPKLGE
jgi:hypothetical protein